MTEMEGCYTNCKKVDKRKRKTHVTESKKLDSNTIKDKGLMECFLCLSTYPLLQRWKSQLSIIIHYSVHKTMNKICNQLLSAAFFNLISLI